MPLIESTFLVRAIDFFATYAISKGADYAINKVNSSEMTVEEHIYCVLTESLKEFCANYSCEFDENAFRETFSYTAENVGKFQSDTYLKKVFEKATSLELTPELQSSWCKIVYEHILSDRHQKLYRAIQSSRIKGDTSNLVEPMWMRKIPADNFIEIHFDGENELDSILCNIKTGLSEACWHHTQELLLELFFNACTHGLAKQISLAVDKEKISLLDDGLEFDPLGLTEKEEIKGGGTWTINYYLKNYPEVKISYIRLNDKNETTIDFGEHMFNVNGLCEIELEPSSEMRKFNWILCYPSSKARYYHVDFNKITTIRVFCMSVARMMVSKLLGCCKKLSSEVYVYIPKSEDFIWDSVADKLKGCIEHYGASNIHLLRN